MKTKIKNKKELVVVKGKQLKQVSGIDAGLILLGFTFTDVK